MKRKIIALIISIISIVSLSVFIGTVSADGEPSALTIKDVNYANPWYGSSIMVGFNSINCTDWAPIDKTYIELKDADGKALTIETVETQGAYVLINRNKTAPAQGTRVTFKKGFFIDYVNNTDTLLDITDYVVEKDITYVYATVGTPWVQELTIKDVNYANPWYGASIMVGFNEISCVDWAPIDKTYIELKDADGKALTIETVETQGAYVLINRNKTAPAQDTTVTFKKGFYIDYVTNSDEVVDITGFVLLKDTTYKYSTVNSPWVLQVSEEEKYVPSSSDATLSIAKNSVEADDISYMPTAWGYPTVQIKFNSTGKWNLFAPSASGFDYVELVHADGSKAVTQDVLNADTTYFIFRFAEAELAKIKVGDKFVLKQGMYLQEKESLKDTLTYVFTNVSTNSAMVLYNPSLHDLSSLAISNEDSANEVVVGGELQLTLSYNEGALFTPTYASDNTDVATVDATGKVTGVAAGTANITVTCGTLTDTYEVSVVNPPEVTGIEGDIFYDLIAVKDSTVTIPANFTVKKVYDNGTKSAAIALTSDNSHFKAAVDTSVIPAVTGKTKATVVVSLDDEDYELELYVTIYEVAKLQFTEAAVVDWFGYATFVEFPNVSVNKANFTGDTEVSVGDLPDYADHIEYYRDGTKISCGAMLLGGGNIALFPTKNNPDATITLENFGTDYYKAGDVILLKEGLTTYGHTGITDAANGVWTNAKGQLYKESVLESDVMFKFNGVGWDLYIPYTDVAVESATIEVALGTNNISVGAKRVPDNATSGTFTYSSSNTQVVTVSETGKLTGVAEGTATITITLEGEESVGPKTTTVTVTVTNKIVKLEIAEVYKLGKGETEIDLTKIVAKYVKGDGTKVDATDIASAQIIGFDAEAGAQTVTVVITHEGQRYTANLDIEVAKSGCGSTIATTSIITLLASIAFVALKKKEN